ncbi:MFS transporter [Chloroflexota bacterium]
MIKRRRFPKIFFGWWTVLATGMVAMWSSGFHGYGFSALFKPIASELGFSRAATSVAAGIGRFEGGFEAPLSGWVADRFGPRWIVLAGISLSFVGFIMMYFINSLWAYYVVWGLIIGTGFNIAITIPLDKAISNWFVKKRGLAISIKTVFSGLGGVLLLPLIAWLIATQGWRMTCVIGGLIVFFIGIPLVWFFLKQHRPEYYGLLPDGAAVEEGLKEDTVQMIDRGIKYAAEVQEVEFTLRQALRTPTYWLLIAASASHGLVDPAIRLHTIPFLTDIGIDPLKAAGMMSIMILASIPARLVGGFLSDRVKKSQLRFLVAGSYLLQGLGFTVFLLNQTTAMIYAWFILYGIGMGIGFALMAPMRARYFGRKAFGSINGISQAISTPVGIAAPIYAGWVYDTTGSYITAFSLFVALLAFSTVLMSLILPPKPPAEVTDINKFV